MTKTGFSLFQYVMVIILDNKSDNDYFIKTKDNVNVLVNSEILTLFKTNKSLDNLTRIFVIQKLEDFDDMNDDSGKYKSQAVIERTKCIQDKYNGLERLYEGLQFTIRAQEETDNFQNSPFISVFCRNFIEKSIDTPFPEIASNIQREIKLNYSYVKYTLTPISTITG